MAEASQVVRSETSTEKSSMLVVVDWVEMSQVPTMMSQMIGDDKVLLICHRSMDCLSLGYCHEVLVWKVDQVSQRSTGADLSARNTSCNHQTCMRISEVNSG